ncbi:MAG: thioredoxin family protein [Arcobacteraceae bacterium]|nr:thioredoxin family protein [Arcobacteraceae bacterium]
MTLAAVQNIIKENSAVLLYFSGENCGVCKALQPKIKASFDEYFPKIEQIYLNAKTNQDISINFNVFSVPTILVFLDGKEQLRKGRNISIPQFIEEVKRPYNLFLS